MPNRILRDWTDSDAIESLSCEAERFFTRLIMKADDYGCYYADPKRLRVSLFPIKDSVRVEDMQKLLVQCQEAGLINLYNSGGKSYVVICKFHQRLRVMKRKFPEPSPESLEVNPKNRIEEKPECQSDDGQMTVICRSKQILNRIYQRDNNFHWSYAEECSLAEICRREGALVEVNAMEEFWKKAGEYFPKSVYSLLSKWNETLDRSKLQQTTPAKPKTHSVFEIKTIMEAKQREADSIRNKHTSESPTGTEWSSLESRAQYRAIRAEIKQLNNQLANL